ncbi:cardiolipin synthase [Canibacter oris]|uniref:Cardiolipin synthase n=1 Tax=Canibacter oris TaxID=1365628 RepID=A0A840DP04_9MICO|nr:cardiolipin synthase [Canibacter oris]MBB4070926.1 cardiolipin synthase [Canibacter oris]
MNYFGIELSWWQILLPAVDTVIRITALFTVPRNRRPSSGMAWLLFIFFLPIPAALLFAVIGRRNLPKQRRERLKRFQKGIREQLNDETLLAFPVPQQPRRQAVENAIKIARTLGAFPMVGGNTAQLWPEYHESIAQMAAAIDRATRFVHMEFYILVQDDTTAPVFEALERATKRGVKVYVLTDHISAVRNPGMRRTRLTLQRIGAEYRYMLPIRPWRGQWQRPDLRNHRKLLVIDGEIGFMGSQNLVDSSYNKLSNRRRGLHWKDLMVELQGPAVLALEAVFLNDWYAETGQVLEQVAQLEPVFAADATLEAQLLPSGPGYATENNLQVFVALMYAAVSRIRITSPYFIPDGALMSALKAATARGVSVELFVSEIGDQFGVYHAQRSYYEELLTAGVKIYLFRPPYILHSKHFSIDEDVAVIGSSNMDQRSFNLNFEISLIVHSAEFAAQLHRVTDDYRGNSRELTLQEWQQQPLPKQLFDNLLRLTSALQ